MPSQDAVVSNDCGGVNREMIIGLSEGGEGIRGSAVLGEVGLVGGFVGERLRPEEEKVLAKVCETREIVLAHGSVRYHFA